MNHYCAPGWNKEDQSRSSHKPDSEFVELNRRNGRIVMQSQSKPSSSVPEPKFDPSAWLEYPADDPLGGEFAELFSGIPGIDVGSSMQIGSGSGPAVGVDESSTCRSIQADTEVKDVPTTMQAGTTFDPTLTSSASGGSDSSIGRTVPRSLKRKGRDATDHFEYQSEDAEYESVGANRPKAQRSQSTRKSRAAEVHNLSERRRRDRINEKMKALQELIPHCNKSDKASMLDEAIAYLKSLQLQVQIMWMGSGMTPMMLPSVNQYVPPSIEPPVLNPVNIPTRTQNAQVPESYTPYVGLTNAQILATQAMNSFTYGPHIVQQNQMGSEDASGSLPIAGISSEKNDGSL